MRYTIDVDAYRPNEPGERTTFIDVWSENVSYALKIATERQPSGTAFVISINPITEESE